MFVQWMWFIFVYKTLILFTEHWSVVDGSFNYVFGMLHYYLSVEFFWNCDNTLKIIKIIIRDGAFLDVK